MKLRKIIFIQVLLVLSLNVTYSQVIFDPLQGSTVGTKVGGSYTSEGYKPGLGENHILYQVPSQVQNGYVEVEIKGFNFSDFEAGVSTQTPFFVMYDGRGVSEPLQYFYDYRNNYFRWEVTYRSDKLIAPLYGNRFKGKMHIAADTPERLNSTHAIFPIGDGSNNSDWSNEPNGIRKTWDPNKWYTIRAEWENTNKDFKIYRDGEEVWHNKKHFGEPYAGDTDDEGNIEYPSTPAWPWLPIDFKIWLGSGPRQYSNKMPDIVFRNFKVIDLGGGSSVDTLEVNPSSKTVSHLEGELSVSVSSNVFWNVTDDADWISLNLSSGNGDGQVIINYDENFSENPRVGTVTINGGSLSRSVTIMQNGKTADYIIVSPDSFNVNFIADSVLFNVESNIAWTVSSQQEWVTFQPSDSTGDANLIVSYSLNTNSDTRSAIIKIGNDSLFTTVKLIQSGSNFYINAFPKIWPVAENSGTVSFYVESNHSWELFPQDTWLTTSFKDSSGNASFLVNYKANTDTSNRIGSILIQSEFDVDSVNVIQGGAEPVEINVQVNPPEAGSVQGTGIYGKGAEITLVAFANVGWVFEDWVEEDSVVYSDSSWTFKLQNSRNIKANFQVLTNVETGKENLPEKFELFQNFPNPFNPTTNIRFNLSQQSIVQIKIYNSLGQQILQPINNFYSAGKHEYQLDATLLPSGIYFYSILVHDNTGNQYFDTKRMILLK